MSTRQKYILVSYVILKRFNFNLPLLAFLPLLTFTTHSSGECVSVPGGVGEQDTTCTGNTTGPIFFDPGNNNTVVLVDGSTLTSASDGLVKGGVMNNTFDNFMISGKIDVDGRGIFNNVGFSSIIISSSGVINSTADTLMSGIFITSGSILNFGIITTAGAGINIASSGTVTNYGVISSSNDLIGAVSLNMGYVTNAGVIISSHSRGILNFDGDVFNSGVITSAADGISIYGGIITNSGTVHSTGGNALYVAAGTADVTNSGTLVSDGASPTVEFANGTTGVFRNTGGNIISTSSTFGSISFANGNDQMIIGNYSHITSTINGGTGTNTLRFELSGLSPEKIAELQNNFTLGLTSGTLFSRGETYIWENFQTLELSATSYQLTSGLNSNQKAIATALDNQSTIPSEDMKTVLNTLDTTSDLSGALTQLSPENLTIMTDASFTNSTFRQAMLNRRIQDVRSGHSGLELSSLRRPSGNSPTTSGAQLAYNSLPGVWDFASAADMGMTSSEYNAPPADKNWGVFLNPNAVFSDPKLGGNYAGLIGGLDYRFTDEWMAGVMLQYGKNNADLDNSSGEMENKQFAGGLYGGWMGKRSYLNGLMTLGNNSFTTKRNISFGGLNRTAEASPKGKDYSFGIQGGRDFKVNRWIVGPTIGGSYVKQSIDGYTESGAGAVNLQMDKQTTDSLRSSLGFRSLINMKGGSKSFTPEIHASWQHEFNDKERDMTASFAEGGMPAFTVSADAPAEDYALYGIGFNAMINSRWVFYGIADFETGAGETATGISGGARYYF